MTGGGGVTSSIIDAITSGSRTSCGGGTRRVSIDSTLLPDVIMKKKRNSSSSSTTTTTPSALFVSSYNNNNNNKKSTTTTTTTSSSSHSGNDRKNNDSGGSSSSTMLKRKRVQFVDNNDEKLTTTTTTTATATPQRIPRKKKIKLHRNINPRQEDGEKGSTTGEFPNSSCLLPVAEDTAAAAAATAAAMTTHPRQKNKSSSTMMTSVVQVTNIPDGANKSGVEMLIDTTTTTTATAAATSRRGVSKIEVRDGVATITLATATTKATARDQAQVEARARQMAQDLDGQWWGGRCVKARVVSVSVTVPFLSAAAAAAANVNVNVVVDHQKPAAGNDATSTTTSSSITSRPLWTDHRHRHHRRHREQEHDDYHRRHIHDDGGYGGHVACENDGSNQQESTQTAREQRSHYEQQQQQQQKEDHHHQRYLQQQVTSSEVNVDDDYSYYGHGYEDSSEKDHYHYGQYGYENNKFKVPDHHQQQLELEQHHTHVQYNQAINSSTRRKKDAIRKKWIGREDLSLEINGIVKAPYLETVIGSHVEGFEEIKADVSSCLHQYCSRHGLQVQIDASLVWINRRWTATARSRGLGHNVYSGLFQFRDKVQMQKALSCLRGGITYCGNKLDVTVPSQPRQQQSSRDSKYGPATTTTTTKEFFHQAGDRGQLLPRAKGINTKDFPVSSKYQDRAAVFVTYVDRTCHIDDLSSFLAHSLIMDGVACQPDILHSFYFGKHRNLPTAYVEFDNFEHAATLEDMGHRGALKFMGRTLRVSRWQRTIPPSIKHTFRSYYLPLLRRPTHISGRNSDVGGSPDRQLRTTQATETSRGPNDGTGSIVGNTSHCKNIEQGIENPVDSKNPFADLLTSKPSSTESAFAPNDKKDHVADSGMTSETAGARTEPCPSMSVKGEPQWGSIESVPNTILKMEEFVEKQLQEIIELRLRVEILSDERNENLISLQEDVQVLTGQLNGIQQRHNQAVQSLMMLTVANREEKTELKIAIEEKRRQTLLKEQELENNQ